MLSLDSPSFAFIFENHDRTIVLDGIKYRIISECYRQTYPYTAIKYRITLDPVHDSYQSGDITPKYLNGHFLMDVEDIQDENYEEILRQLGYE
jgi:hypothetical protein